MKKIDFLNTVKGRKHLKLKRDMSCLYFNVNQEPKSKESIKLEEKKYFQEEILKTIKKHKRCVYREPLLMEITFNSSPRNSPSIYKLAKNYLDLLGKPLKESFLKRKGLLYKDDSLIRILIVNHHFCFAGEAPSIFIRTKRLKHFLDDLRIIEDFDLFDGEEDGNLFYSTDLDLLKNDLRWQDEKKEDLIKKYGKDFYCSNRDYTIKRMQEVYLKEFSVSIKQIIFLINTAFKNRKYSFWPEFENIDSINRKLLIGSDYPIKKIKLPENKHEHGNGKATFRVDFKEIMDDFKRKFPNIFPLNSVISVTILYIPPKGVLHDLDNIARLIIPEIIESLQPPASLLQRINPGSFNGDDFMSNRLNDIKNYPKNAITQYQVIDIPRGKDDPEDGMVKVLLGSGYYLKSLLMEVDRLVDGWYEDDRFSNDDVF